MLWVELRVPLAKMNDFFGYTKQYLGNKSLKRTNSILDMNTNYNPTKYLQGGTPIN